MIQPTRVHLHWWCQEKGDEGAICEHQSHDQDSPEARGFERKVSTSPQVHLSNCARVAQCEYYGHFYTATIRFEPLKIWTVQAPPPYIWPSQVALDSFHKLCNNTVFYTVITSKLARYSVHLDKILKEWKHSLCVVIIPCANSGDQTWKTVNKTMEDYFPPY